MLSFLLNALAVSAVAGALALLMLALRPVLERRYSARLRCAVWWALGLWLCLPLKPTLPQAPVQVRLMQAVVEQQVDLPAPVQQTPQPVEPSAQQGQAAQAQAGQGGLVPVIQPTPVPAAQPEPQPVRQQGWTLPALALWQWLALGWAAVAALVLAVRLAGYARWRRRICRWNTPVREERLLALNAGACRAAGVQRPVKIYHNPYAGCPMVMGLLRPVLLLPEGLPPDDATAMMLLHEYTHLARRDLWLKFLLVLACGLHWFNPAVWLAARAVGQDIELACDERALKGRPRAWRDAYGRALLAGAVGKPYPVLLATRFSAGKRGMMRRLRAVFDTGGKKRGVALFFVLLLTGGLVVGLVACGMEEAQPAPSGQDAAPQAEPLADPLPAMGRVRALRHTDAENYYCVNTDDYNTPKMVTAVNLKTGVQSYVCSLPGCGHDDPGCEAFLQEARSYSYAGGTGNPIWTDGERLYQLHTGLEYLPEFEQGFLPQLWVDTRAPSGGAASYLGSTVKMGQTVQDIIPLAAQEGLYILVESSSCYERDAFTYSSFDLALCAGIGEDHSGDGWYNATRLYTDTMRNAVGAPVGGVSYLGVAQGVPLVVRVIPAPGVAASLSDAYREATRELCTLGADGLGTPLLTWDCTGNPPAIAALDDTLYMIDTVGEHSGELLVLDVGTGYATSIAQSVLPERSYQISITAKLGDWLVVDGYVDQDSGQGAKEGIPVRCAVNVRTGERRILATRYRDGGGYLNLPRIVDYNDTDLLLYAGEYAVMPIDQFLEDRTDWTPCTILDQTGLCAW